MQQQQQQAQQKQIMAQANWRGMQQRAGKETVGFLLQSW